MHGRATHLKGLVDRPLCSDDSYAIHFQTLRTSEHIYVLQMRPLLRQLSFLHSTEHVKLNARQEKRGTTHHHWLPTKGIRETAHTSPPHSHPKHRRTTPFTCVLQHPQICLRHRLHCSHWYRNIIQTQVQTQNWPKNDTVKCILPFQDHTHHL